MNGKKAKMLRRICWTDKPNGRSRTLKNLKAEYRKGVSVYPLAFYPRQGRDWRELVK